MSASTLPMHIVSGDRDSRLVEALLHGEPSAAERLVTTYQDWAYRLAIRIAGNAQDAEEIVQDAFLTVIRKIDTFRGESAFGSWLYRIVANGAYRKLRRRPGQRMEIALDDVLPAFDVDGRHAAPVADWSACVDDPSRRTELRLAMSSAIDELPAHYRAALVLRDVEGWSCAEVAEALRLSVGNVKARVHRARLFIRKRLAKFLFPSEFPNAIRPPAAGPREHGRTPVGCLFSWPEDWLLIRAEGCTSSRTQAAQHSDPRGKTARV